MRTSPLELRSIHLRVRDLGRSLAFYERQAGFLILRQMGASAELVAGEGLSALITLEADPDATAAGPEDAGLFHAAVLLPSRAALGAWLRVAAGRGLALDGAADHGVSEALYTHDPDGNGLEFCADRARASWPRRNGELAMTTVPLDVPGLLQAGAGQSGSLGGSVWGHLHLRVRDVERSSRHYQQQLGLEVTQRSYPGARFLAADGYHHHLGLNQWGSPRRPQPAGAVGLVAARFVRTGAAGGGPVPDPDGIPVGLAADAG